MKFLNFFIKNNRVAILSSLFLLSFAFSNTIFADFMQSTTYKIQSDSLNFGGADSSSASFKVGDTFGEIGTGDSNSATYYMHAGYQQMQLSSISISSPPDLNMPPMGGLSGGTSEGTASWLVTTDNPAGYSLTVQSSTTPTLKSALDSLADYTPAGGNPDYNFTNLSTSSSFGFSPEGTEVIARFKDNGSACNTGTSETVSKCWDGVTITPKTATGSGSPNMPSGSNSTLRFRAESGANHIQISGAYTATITVTATTL